jgi:hypothetical protein
LAVFLAILADITWFRLVFAHPGNDQSWLLYAAGRMLHGTALYGSQLDETNPPLIIWFSAIPSAISSVTHIYALTVLRIFVGLLALASTAWCLRILRAAGLAKGLVLTSLWTLALLAIEVSQHGNDFGQKEQVLILFLLPLLFYEAVQHLPANSNILRVQFGLPERIALGICAGLSVSFKPQDALILIAFELFLLFYTRNLRRLFRAELLTAVLTGLVYIAAVRILAPLYFTEIVPLLSDTYWAFGEYSALEVVRRCPVFNLVCLLTLIAWVILRRRLRFPAAPLALLAGTAGAAIAYATQNKDWPYQFFPQQAMLACAIAWLLFDATWPLLSPRRTLLTRFLLPLTLVLAALTVPKVYSVGYHHDRLVSQTPDSAFLDSTLAALPPGTPVTLLAINLMGDNDILRGDLTLATRYHHLWMLPSIVLNERAAAGGDPSKHPVTAARLAYLENLQRSNSAEDIRTRRPQVIIIQHCKANEEEPCQGLYHSSFEILPWFLQSREFAAAFAPYRRTSGDDFFDVYTR